MATTSPHALQLLLELRQNPTAVPGWRTKWQLCCELFWEALAAKDATAPEPALLDFINLLTHKDMFALARLSIVELRAGSRNSENAQRQRILDATSQLSAEVIRLERFTQADIDDVRYAAEKRVALHAELHRARVLLHNSGGFAAGEDKIKAWLDMHPDMVGKD